MVLVLRLKPETSQRLGKGSTAWLHPKPKGGLCFVLTLACLPYLTDLNSSSRLFAYLNLKLFYCNKNNISFSGYYNIYIQSQNSEREARGS